MTLRAKMAAGLAMATALVFAGSAQAEPNIDPNPDVTELVINGEIPITIRAPAPDHLDGALPEIYSGWLYRDASTREMEMDDFENPAMPFVDAGIEAWNAVDGSEGKSCADCHGAIEEGMAGVRAVMPKVNEAGALWSMEDYINDCRVNRMGAEAYDWDKQPMKNITAAIAAQSRGMPVNVAIDGAAAPYWEQGREMYYTRYGKLQLSCASCHQENNNNFIRGDHLSQGQINGFPVYRLKQSALVTIHNRFYGCVRDTQAESFAKGGDELRALELYVASRGNGLSVEGPSVRP
ncbi:sulfur oxidation c-type cytochrome SoxA [Sinisalibacter aestuarii]|uniref:SoxAX cytochrome complex subunit A n=1 Tax=Sinisalibacter aestuarii TaxID=2949426 RepID=A0ABQ5LZ30_9RHOB|nr:sulfur oxidation c-type cytochrome SoxA [Sinisalibacter aestuarii]GKY90226.1 SoxAX cytochrome complex subunit A [Sinisalibacter aestuarii]